MMHWFMKVPQQPPPPTSKNCKAYCVWCIKTKAQNVSEDYNNCKSAGRSAGCKIKPIQMIKIKTIFHINKTMSTNKTTFF